MGISKVAAILALGLAVVAHAASANDRTLQVSAVILSKCSIASSAAAATALRCTGSDAATNYRVRNTTDARAVDLSTPARRTQNDAVVTVEF